MHPRLLVFCAISSLTVLASAAIFLPLLDKLQLLGIVRPLPSVASAGERYNLCAYTPDEVAQFSPSAATIRIAGILTPLDQASPQGPTHGQEIGSGTQVACFNIGSFFAKDGGPLDVQLSAPLPRTFKLGVYVSLWKIPVVVIGIIGLGLISAIPPWRFILKRCEKRSRSIKPS